MRPLRQVELFTKNCFISFQKVRDRESEVIREIRVEMTGKSITEATDVHDKNLYSSLKQIGMAQLLLSEVDSSQGLGSPGNLKKATAFCRHLSSACKPSYSWLKNKSLCRNRHQVEIGG